MKRYAIDTGPIVALLNAHDSFHSWTTRVLATIRPPLLTCEAVISETCFLLRQVDGGPDRALELLERRILEVRFRLDAERTPIRRLMTKYRQVPMSVADACLVRMTELDPETSIITLDNDFTI